MSEVLPHENILKRFLSVKGVAFLVAVGIVIISLSEFVSAVSDIAKSIPRISSYNTASYDLKTQEETIVIAVRIDEQFSKLELNPQIPFSDLVEEYRYSEVMLNGLLLRQKARPLNDASIYMVEEVINSYQDFKRLHSQHGELSKTAIKLEPISKLTLA